MANYDQSGKPTGNRNQQGSQQGSAPTGQWQAGQGSQGQQSQYSGGQAQGRGMQQSSARQMREYGGGYGYEGGLFPDLYSGLGGGPFELISRLSDEMDRIFESFGMGVASRGRGAMAQRGQTGMGGPQGMRSLWAPHIEVSEGNGKLLIQADLPGVRKEDVNVQLDQDAVIIQGQRQQESERNEQGFYHSERSYGSFYRMIPLPEGIDVDQANATFKDGVLQIEMPAPQQKQRGRRLEIRDESSQRGQLGTTPSAAGPQAAGQSSAGGQPSAGQGSSQRTGEKS